MRTKPNFDKAKSIAYETLDNHMVTDFPLNILDILKSYDDIKVLTYSEMAKKKNLSIEDVIEINSSEDGVIHYYGKKKKYVILYNDKVKPIERMYWTLAHEFGHYLLNHHKESKRSSLKRNSISIKELDLFEVEANFFARHLITPPPIIVEGKINHYTKVMEFFGVSYTVATNTLKYIKNSYEMGYRFGFPFSKKSLFRNFIIKAIHGKTCNNCNIFSYIRNSKFCIICGSNDFHNFHRGDDLNLIYESIEVDNDMRASKCPRCDNEEVEGNYCKVCAEYLFNVCTGFDPNVDSSSYLQQGIRWADFNQGCDVLLEGNARYCHECGSTSSFYEEGLLEKWNEVSDEDLPF